MKCIRWFWNVNKYPKLCFDSFSGNLLINDFKLWKTCFLSSLVTFLRNFFSFQLLAFLTISAIVAMLPPTTIPMPTFQFGKKVATKIRRPQSGLFTKAGWNNRSHLKKKGFDWICPDSWAHGFCSFRSNVIFVWRVILVKVLRNYEKKTQLEKMRYYTIFRFRKTVCKLHWGKFIAT